MNDEKLKEFIEKHLKGSVKRATSAHNYVKNLTHETMGAYFFGRQTAFELVLGNLGEGVVVNIRKKLEEIEKGLEKICPEGTCLYDKSQTTRDEYDRLLVRQAVLEDVLGVAL